MLAELSRLRAALPGYDVIITSHSLTHRFEAIRRHDDDPGPWCVISTDPDDLWRELGPAGTSTTAPLAHAAPGHQRVSRTATSTLIARSTMQSAKGGQHAAAPLTGTRPVTEVISDQLAARGFGVRTQSWEQVHRLIIAGAAQATASLTIAEHASTGDDGPGDGGYVRWDYRPLPGPATSPAALTRIVLRVLGAAPAGDHPLDDAAYHALPLKGAAGRLAQDHGLAVTLLTSEDTETFAAAADISITNPDQPGRGTIRISDDGAVEWGCHTDEAFPGHPGAIVAVLAPFLRQEPGLRNGHPQP